MDAHLVGRLLRMLLLGLGLLMGIDALDFRGPDPMVPRHILDTPSEHLLGQSRCAPFC